jgi:hypothetical protein
VFAFLVAARLADPIVSLSPYQFARDRSAKRSEASATLRLAPDDSANSNDIRHRSPLRPVAVISTSRKRTIAALRAAFLISREVRTQIRLVSVEVVPGQFPLPEPRTSGAVLERKLRGFVHEAGLSQHEACIQVTACRHWRVGVQKALCANSVVVAGQIHWWSWRERRMMKFLSELGHEVVFANPLPSMRVTRTSTEKKAPLPPLKNSRESRNSL